MEDYAQREVIDLFCNSLTSPPRPPFLLHTTSDFFFTIVAFGNLRNTAGSGITVLSSLSLELPCQT